MKIYIQTGASLISFLVSCNLSADAQSVVYSLATFDGQLKKLTEVLAVPQASRAVATQTFKERIADIQNKISIEQPEEVDLQEATAFILNNLNELIGEDWFDAQALLKLLFEKGAYPQKNALFTQAKRVALEEALRKNWYAALQLLGLLFEKGAPLQKNDLFVQVQDIALKEALGKNWVSAQTLLKFLLEKGTPQQKNTLVRETLDVALKGLDDNTWKTRDSAQQLLILLFDYVAGNAEVFKVAEKLFEEMRQGLHPHALDKLDEVQKAFDAASEKRKKQKAS